MLECESYMIDLHIEIFIVLYLILISIFYFTIFKRKNFSFYKKMVYFALIFYILSLVKLAILPITINMTNKPIAPTINEAPYLYLQYVPFKTVADTIGSNTFFIQIIGNIFLLMPVPIFIQLISERELTLKKTIKVVFLISLSIETIQFIINILTRYPNKVTDIDDLIFNTLGGFLGYYPYKKFKETKLYNQLHMKEE